MKPADLLALFKVHPLVEGIVGHFGREGTKRFRLHLQGLVGSSRSLVTAAVFESTSQTHLVLLPDKESAAYFFNDLQQILGDRVYYFPSSFKRGFQTGIKDNQGLLSRTEVLNHLNSRARKFIVVSYPEAVSEKVVNKKFLEKNTLKLSVGEQVNMDFILDLLVFHHRRVWSDFMLFKGACFAIGKKNLYQ